MTKGRFYTPMRILKECVLDVDEVGIGVNEKRRMVHERTLEHKTKRDGRIRELILAGLEDDEIVKRMVEAGFSDHPSDKKDPRITHAIGEAILRDDDLVIDKPIKGAYDEYLDPATYGYPNIQRVADDWESVKSMLSEMRLMIDEPEL